MATDTRLISIVGKKNSGKTSLVTALGVEYFKRGKSVGTLKHGTHPITLDYEGTDTWRHMHEGRAERTLIESVGHRALFQQLDEASDPVTLARKFMDGLDLVIAEGFTAHPIPKVEVFRREVHDTPKYDPSLDNADQWVAVVTDDPNLDLPIPVFNFADTGWLVTLSKFVWEKAQVLQP